MEQKYSVLMSVYYKENPQYLKLSIESMLSQTLKPDEFVIVKDGPLTKELNCVIEQYKDRYKGVFTIVELPTNIGLGLALNEGLKVCRNNIVARMDSDDISLETRCELQIKEFSLDNNLSIVGTMINEFVEEPNKIISSRIVPLTYDEILKFSRRRSPFNHPTVMYKRDDVLASGGYSNIRRKEDIELFGRMLCQGYKAKNIPKALLLYRTNEDNYQRRKEWSNCKEYIYVIFLFWKNGYSSLIDLIIVIIGQIIMTVSPIWLLKIISNKFLRKSKSS